MAGNLKEIWEENSRVTFERCGSDFRSRPPNFADDNRRIREEELRSEKTLKKDI